MTLHFATDGSIGPAAAAEGRRIDELGDVAADFGMALVAVAGGVAEHGIVGEQGEEPRHVAGIERPHIVGIEVFDRKAIFDGDSGHGRFPALTAYQCGSRRGKTRR